MHTDPVDQLYIFQLKTFLSNISCTVVEALGQEVDLRAATQGSTLCVKALPTARVLVAALVKSTKFISLYLSLSPRSIPFPFHTETTFYIFSFTLCPFLFFASSFFYSFLSLLYILPLSSIHLFAFFLLLLISPSSKLSCYPNYYTLICSTQETYIHSNC